MFILFTLIPLLGYIAYYLFLGIVYNIPSVDSLLNMEPMRIAITTLGIPILLSFFLAILTNIIVLVINNYNLKGKGREYLKDILISFGINFLVLIGLYVTTFFNVHANILFGELLDKMYRIIIYVLSICLILYSVIIYINFNVVVIIKRFKDFGGKL